MRSARSKICPGCDLGQHVVRNAEKKTGSKRQNQRNTFALGEINLAKMQVGDWLDRASFWEGVPPTDQSQHGTQKIYVSASVTVGTYKFTWTLTSSYICKYKQNHTDLHLTDADTAAIQALGRPRGVWSRVPPPWGFLHRGSGYGLSRELWCKAPKPFSENLKKWWEEGCVWFLF